MTTVYLLEIIISNSDGSIQAVKYDHEENVIEHISDIIAGRSKLEIKNIYKVKLDGQCSFVFEQEVKLEGMKLKLVDKFSDQKLPQEYHSPNLKLDHKKRS